MKEIVMLIQAIDTPEELLKNKTGQFDNLQETVERFQLTILAVSHGDKKEFDRLWHPYSTKPRWPPDGNLLGLYAGLLFSIWFILICDEYCANIRNFEELRLEYVARLKAIWHAAASICVIVNNSFNQFINMTGVLNIDKISEYLMLPIEPNYDFLDFVQEGVLVFWAACCRPDLPGYTFH